MVGYDIFHPIAGRKGEILMEIAIRMPNVQSLVGEHNQAVLPKVPYRRDILCLSWKSLYRNNYIVLPVITANSPIF